MQDRIIMKFQIFAISIIVLVSACIEQRAQASDFFSVSDLKYEPSKLGPPSALYVRNYENHTKFVAATTFVISLKEDIQFVEGSSLYYRISPDMNPGPYLISKKEIKVEKTFEIDSLEQQLQLEVCVGRITNEQTAQLNSGMKLDKYPDILCKNITFPEPKIDVLIFPDSITFTLKKGQTIQETKSVSIKNIGNVKQEFYVKGAVQISSPVYNFSDNLQFSVVNLMPGESRNFSILANIDAFIEPGVYNSTVHIQALQNFFDKEFKIVTTVID